MLDLRSVTHTAQAQGTAVTDHPPIATNAENEDGTAVGMALDHDEVAQPGASSPPPLSLSKDLTEATREEMAGER